MSNSFISTTNRKNYSSFNRNEFLTVLTKYVNENEAAIKERVGVFWPKRLSTKRMNVVKNNDILKRLV